VALVPFWTGRFFVSGVSSMAGQDGGVDLRLFGVGGPVFDGAGFGGPWSGGTGYDGFAREAARDRWGDGRGGSVCLNSSGRFAKWISASIMPPPSLVSAR
jgi:hypothetical protein